ncbi:MAG TPA: type IV pilus modification protein PilV [Steroidobacteraceae bacterium]
MSQHPNTHSGFSLIEVMVALIIIAVGMLGIAKMQALALSTTESSGVRSLVAIEAASLAASMHTNRDYWVSAPPPASFTVSVLTTAPGTVTVNVNDTTGVLSAASNCATTTVCTAPQVAAYDVQQWGAALGQVVPAALATISCNTTTVPLSCTIQISWQENVTATNNATAAVSSAAGLLNSPQYTLYVEP